MKTRINIFKGYLFYLENFQEIQHTPYSLRSSTNCGVMGDTPLMDVQPKVDWQPVVKQWKVVDNSIP